MSKMPISISVHRRLSEDLIGINGHPWNFILFYFGWGVLGVVVEVVITVGMHFKYVKASVVTPVLI